ncbi:MAG TPA: hypothetical protein VJ692_05795 [Nitrospiraceae bacterium]|nr:hypothetical protein [Nitrospiraceae bacterium]
MAQVGLTTIWEVLSRDVSFCCGIQSPMLSWIGSGGIGLFFLWHVITLWREVSASRRPFTRLRPTLAELAQRRQHLHSERFSAKALMSTKAQRRQTPPADEHRDCDDLQALDAAMQQESFFGHAWTQFRKTLLVEHDAWFREPKIYSTRQAEDFFTPDALFHNRVHLASYSQFPSLITGIGLLLTFLALFIGLGKLHADGHNIEGIQGLINGLAGKFLSSIVGLVCANAFSLIEKPLLFRLTAVHQEFLDRLNELFPRKTMEQILENLAAQQHARADTRAQSPTGAIEHLKATMASSLGEPVAALTSTLQSFIRLKEGQDGDARALVATEVRRAIQGSFEPSLKDLKGAIRDLTQTLKDLKAAPVHDAKIEQVLTRLTEVMDRRMPDATLPLGMRVLYGQGPHAQKGAPSIERGRRELDIAPAQAAG